MPATIPYQGGTLTIFSGADWGKFAGSKRPADYDNPGIIFYLKKEPPRRKAPNKPPATPGTGAQQSQQDKQAPKQDPVDTNSQGPTDDGVVTEDWVGDAIMMAGVVVVVVGVGLLAIALLPEEAVGAAAVGVASAILDEAPAEVISDVAAKVFGGVSSLF